MFRIRALLLYRFFLICFLPLNSLFAQTCSQDIYFVWFFDKDNQNSLRIINEVLPATIFLTEITYDCDIVFSREELIALLGFNQGVLITRDQLHNGLQQCGYKEKFEKISVRLQKNADGWSLHCTFSAWWTVLKVRCRGPLFGKDRYQQGYSLRPGKRFDPIQHHKGLQCIEDLLRDDGYLAAEVTDVLVYDDEYKTISVVLLLEQDNRYVIRSTSAVIIDEINEKTTALCAKIKRIAMREIVGNYATKYSLDDVVHQIEELCIRDGFLQPLIQYESVPNHNNHEAHIIFKIALGERRRFTFFGNHFFSDRELYERMLFFGKSISLFPPSILVDELLGLYKESGFWSAAITLQEEQDRCLFCISEGPRSSVRGVRFEGVSYFSHKDFSALCSEMIHSEFFDKKKQRAVRERIIQSYVSQGFWDCEIVSETFQPVQCNSVSKHKQEKHDYEYCIVIQEGLQRKIRSVKVPGFEECLQMGALRQYNELHKAIPFDIHMVQEQRRALLEYLHMRGYIYANPKPLLQQDVQGSIDVIWQVENPVKVHFGSTILAGASRLPRGLITRELDFQKGDVWNQKKLQSSTAHLKALGIFDGVSIRKVGRKLGTSDQNEFQDVVVTCIDDDPFEIRARAGMQCIGQYLQMNALGVRYGGSLLWKNPTNRADRLQVALDISPHVRYGDATYTLPWFFSLPLMTTFSVYSSRFDEALMNCFKNKLYRLTQDGGECEFEYAQDSKKYGISFGFESMKITCIAEELARLIDFSPQLINERVPYWYCEPVCMITRLDDLINPTCGTVSILTAKAMLPLHARDSGFVKLLCEQSFFVPVLDRLVVALRLRAGHIFYTVFSRIMPSERFYLGGAYSLRGYDTDMAPPVNTCASRLVSGCLLPIGGKTILSAMCEFRFPVYKALGGVVFTDFGMLVRDNFREDDIVGATGFGLRYATPVGALRFDIAWKWRRQQGEKHLFSWFLTLGQAF